MDISRAPDPSLLPSPFGPDELWVASLIDTRFGGHLEQLVLCDPSTGVARLQQEYAAPAASHTLVMAMSLANLRRLRAALDADASSAEVIDARRLGATREWPLWLSGRDSLFVALVEQDGEARSMWVCASNRAEAHAALAVAHPGIKILGVGSLGGLIAAAAAERFGLPGLAQNSPGWMTRQPEPDRLDKFLQVRTARDVVADWGCAYPRNLMLPDPEVPDWSLSGLHNLERQNQLIENHGIGHCRVDDHNLAPPATDEACTSPATQAARFFRALEKLRAARAYTQVHNHLSLRAKP